jgi:hypothetical protein
MTWRVDTDLRELNKLASDIDASKFEGKRIELQNEFNLKAVTAIAELLGLARSLQFQVRLLESDDNEGRTH